MKIYYNLNAQYNAYSEMQNHKTIAQLLSVQAGRVLNEAANPPRKYCSL
jgi:hypothetical protein